MPHDGDHLDRVRLRLVPAGEGAPPDLLGRGEVWLDVGGDVREGVIDHRHWPSYRGSSARLVLRHPELLESAVGPGGAGDVTLVLRHTPGLDAVTSAYLAAEYLRTGGFGPHAQALVEYADLLATGHPGVQHDNLFTPYAAYHTILRRYDEREGDAADRWEAAAREGFRVIAESVRQVEANGVSFSGVDAFRTPKVFGKKDRAWVREDLARYRKRLHDPGCHARMETVRLPGRFAADQAVPGLLIRHVQDSRDEGAVAFFKDWARSDRENAPPGAAGFEFLSVYGLWTEGQAYAMLSLPPESGACLKGLAARLTGCEAKAGRRGRAKAGDRRLAWSDGYGYTLVRSPPAGTKLGADEIERVVLEFGGAAAAPADRIPTDPDWDRLDVFISYPRSRQEWVLANVYAPLVAWRGADRVFLDRDALPTGGAWLPRLARGVGACRHFLAVVCPEYFQSEFCSVEMTWALTGDILGTRRKVIPLIIEPVEPIPEYCRHIQFHDVRGKNLPAALRQILRPLLEK
jgi:hypothetical protein